VWASVGDHRAHLEVTGTLAERRSRRLLDELRAIVVRRLEQRALALGDGALLDRLHRQVVERRLDPYAAAEEIIAGVSPPP